MLHLGVSGFIFRKNKPRDFFSISQAKFLKNLFLIKTKECIREDKSFKECAVKVVLIWTKIGDMWADLTNFKKLGAYPFFTVSKEYCIYSFQYMTDKCVANSVSRIIGKSTLFPAEHQYL